MNTAVTVASTEATADSRRADGYPLSGLVVYAVVLAAQVIAALTRALVWYLQLLALGLIVGRSPSTAEHLALLLAFGPLAWSLLGLFVPAEGWLIQQRYGGRRPSAREQAAYQDALDAIHATDPSAPTPRSWFVVDQGDFGAAVLGDTLMIVRATFHDGTLEATLAHELGHLAHHDGRITVALIRVTFLARQLEGQPAGPGLFAALMRAVNYLASGQLSMRLLKPLWAGYFRECEYRADEYAARLGYARELIELFEGVAVYDQPVAFAWMKSHSHPPSELRIDRLQGYFAVHPDHPGAGGRTRLGDDHDLGRPACPGDSLGLGPGTGDAPAAAPSARALPGGEGGTDARSARVTPLPSRGAGPQEPPFPPPTKGRAA